jgi:glycosyltransferase involved in cell wall biosynthesis
LLQAIPALFLAKLKRVPLVIWVQDLWPQSLSATGYIKNRFILWFVEKIVRFIYKHADLLLVQSQAFIEPVRLLACDTPIKYYPNSVDESFSRVPEVNVPNLPGLGEAFSVVFAGNIGVAQAPEVILDAATLLKENKDIHFVVFGDGTRREWMIEQVSRRGISNLHLPGRYPVEDMPGFMQKASVLLVTLADREIFAATVPNKIQAYMAAGRPIIACMNGQGALLVDEAQAGYTVPAENHELLAEAVLRIFKLPAAERDRLGANARSYYRKHFDHKTLINELIKHFEDLRVGS